MLINVNCYVVAFRGSWSIITLRKQYLTTCCNVWCVQLQWTKQIEGKGKPPSLYRLFFFIWGHVTKFNDFHIYCISIFESYSSGQIINGVNCGKVTDVALDDWEEGFQERSPTFLVVSEATWITGAKLVRLTLTFYLIFYDNMNITTEYFKMNNL